MISESTTGREKCQELVRVLHILNSMILFLDDFHHQDDETFHPQCYEMYFQMGSWGPEVSNLSKDAQMESSRVRI